MTDRDRLDFGQRAAAAPRLWLGMPPEKAAAWALRALSQVAWILLLVVAWQIRDRMAQIDGSIAALSRQLGQLARTVESDGRASAGLRATVDQHETRLVGLEQRVGTVEAKVRP